MVSLIAAEEALKSRISLPPPRLLPRVARDTARAHPEKTWGSIPIDRQSPKAGYEDVSYRRFVYAVDRAAWWIRKHLEPQMLRPFEHLAYLGVPDSRYQILALAATMAGFQMLFLSPRNTDIAQYRLVDQSDCHKWLFTAEYEDTVKALVDGRPENKSAAHQDLMMLVPDQRELLKDEPVPEFPYHKTVEEARAEPFLTLHTSSTTGLPKLNPLMHGHGFLTDHLRHFPAVNGLDVLNRKIFDGHCRLYLGMPLFHGGGIVFGIWTALYQDVVIVFQPPDAPVSAGVINDIIVYGRCTGVILPPFLVEEMVKMQEYFNTLAGLDFVQFGSGPLSKHAGDVLLTRQKSCPHFIGGSEYGLPPVLELEDPVNEWMYFHFHPWTGAEMRPFGDEPELFELWIKKLDGSIPGLQHPFEAAPELDAYGTKDLFRRHPEKPYLWRVAGRADDLLVLNNGLKLNPVDMESLITNAHPNVTGALVVGHGRFQPTLLLEVKDIDVSCEDARTKLIEDIWPKVEAANEIAPKYGQLTKSLVVFSSPNKPFLRTPKMSVRRKPTADLYSAEIEIVYNFVENDASHLDRSDLPKHFDLKTRASSERFVQELVQKVTRSATSPKPGADFFALGMDSLQVVRIVRAVKAALKDFESSNSQADITMSTIYSHPTAEDLSKTIFHLVHTSNSEELTEQSTTGPNLSRTELIQNSFERWTNAIDIEARKNRTVTNIEVLGSDAQRSWNVILTGSTGTLGKYLLESLALHPRVSKVICLNRDADAAQKWETRRLSRGFPDDANDRIQHLHTTNLGAPFLGLEESVYEALSGSVTHVVHNAWPVNFHMALASYEPVHIGGVCNLVNLCAKSTKYAKLFFVSTVGSVALGGINVEIPEKVFYNHDLPSHTGYAESKYLSELVVDAASKVSNGRISTVILRVGQIAGPVGPEAGVDVWNINEWLPTILRSSKTIRALPASLGRFERVDWLPVNSMNKVIVELIEAIEHRPARAGSVVYHVINPTAVTWSAFVLPLVKDYLKVDRVVSLTEWTNLVAAGPGPEDTTNPNPAIKLLSFYRELDSLGERLDPLVRTDVTEYESAVLSQVGPVKEEWIRKWVEDVTQ